jgi:hypothetical protein
MKLRPLLMGAILSLLGIALLIARGYQESYGVLVVGVIPLVVGVIWP